MGRFLSGLIWGVIFAVFCLAVMSLIAPLPDRAPAEAAVELSEKSEFNRPPPDDGIVVPEADEVAALAPAVAPVAPALSVAPTTLSDDVTTPATQPEVTMDVPEQPVISLTPAPLADLPSVPSDAPETPSLPGLSEQGQAPAAPAPQAPTVDGAAAAGVPLTTALQVPAPDGVAMDPAGVDEPALVRNAVAFVGDGRPLFAVVLIDGGDTTAMDRLAAQSLAFPVTFALDPSDPRSAEHAAQYRAAGHEVMITTDILPERATGNALDEALSGAIAGLPTALGLLDPDGSNLRTSGPRFAAVMAGLAVKGYGFLTPEQGLGTPVEDAGRAGVPAGLIFRQLDANDERANLIDRYLDRAAFKADQDGSVIMLGRVRGETLAALVGWAVAGRGGRVQMAPISAVLQAR